MLVIRPSGGTPGGTVKLSGYPSPNCTGSASDIIAATAWASGTESAQTLGSYGSVKLIGASYSGPGTIAVTYIGTLDHWGTTSGTGARLVEVEGLESDPPHDDPDSGNPVKIGGRAVSFGATPTAVAAADRTNFYATRAGIPFVQPGHPNIVTLEAQIEDADGAQTNAAIVTVSAGTKIVVTGVAANCDARCAMPS